MRNWIIINGDGPSPQIFLFENEREANNFFNKMRKDHDNVTLARIEEMKIDGADLLAMTLSDAGVDKNPRHMRYIR